MKTILLVSTAVAALIAGNGMDVVRSADLISGKFKVMYTFAPGADGRYPYSNLIADANGNFYGTTYAGGEGACPSGCGTVFKLKTDGTEKVLYSFQGGPNDGALPVAGLTIDKTGNLYGTTSAGGSTACGGTYGCGTIFKIAADGKETVLHIFNGGSDGAIPQAGVILDKKGNLYGTAETGGTGPGCGFSNGCGTVFKVTSDGSFTVVYNFCQSQYCPDGMLPTATLIRDDKGNLYGTAYQGGDEYCLAPVVGGCGVVFKLAPTGKQTVLHAFTGYPDGNAPYAGLIADGAGNFYGTTVWGGSGECVGDYQCGAVFKITPKGTETVVYSLRGGSDGQNPLAGVIVTKNGSLYGTTYAGGNSGCVQNEGCGVVFRVATDGTETVLHTFDAYPSGWNPSGALIKNGAGSLYGTTQGGGDGYGTIFKVRK
jgi:uncharacterized repeat protein (TIGR03803 family)